MILNLKKKKHKKEKLRPYLLHRPSEVQNWEYLATPLINTATFFLPIGDHINEVLLYKNIEI